MSHILLAGGALPEPGAELLPDLGDLGTDDYLAVHHARIVAVEELVLPFRRIKRLEGNDLGHHRSAFGPGSIQLLMKFSARTFCSSLV